MELHPEAADRLFPDLHAVDALNGLPCAQLLDHDCCCKVSLKLSPKCSETQSCGIFKIFQNPEALCQPERLVAKEKRNLQQASLRPFHSPPGPVWPPLRSRNAPSILAFRNRKSLTYVLQQQEAHDLCRLRKFGRGQNRIRGTYHLARCKPPAQGSGSVF